MSTPYHRWRREVSRVIYETAGVSAMDLADQPWRDWFDDDLSPEEAAAEALEAEGF